MKTNTPKREARISEKYRPSGAFEEWCTSGQASGKLLTGIAAIHEPRGSAAT
jgi:hypothetical protein